MSTYYVGIGGNDGNAGTSWALRKETVAAGESLCTSAGDILYIGPGVYDESVTFNNTGSSGNPIFYIGDYTGANTDGVGGSVVLRGGAQTVTAEYQVLRSVVVIGTSGVGSITITNNNVTVDGCWVDNLVTGGAGIFCGSGAAGISNTLISNCFLTAGSGAGIKFRPTADDASKSGNIIENCIVIGGAGNGGTGIMIDNQSGVTVRNCLLWGVGDYGIRATSLPATESITVNNCMIHGVRWALHASAAGELIEDYNNISSCTTARTNVSTGDNSTAHNPDFDSRWFFEATHGGSMVTPFDLASYSGLVELNSGTGAPAADLRGTTVQGTYREYGALEYDATLDIEAGTGGAGGGGPVIGSRVIRGIGAL